ncbi:MAG: 4-hydroxy-3-methylbut-2-enyl diphosphate reductase [Chloroflexota bacterium]|nr:4-hydroxy-3-methylbut-2-enyl diphosphate reductase [Chloroflexota bacterium]
MEIEKAAEIGFCTGVRRAIEMIERAAAEIGPLHTLGPIVHNQQVVERLARFGVAVADSLGNIEGGTMAISSHGVGPQIIEEAEARDINIIDTTCPFVRRTQAAAKKLANAGFSVVVFGDRDHPEVQGVLGYAGEKGLATIEVPPFESLSQRVGILSQTTQSFSAFHRFVSAFVEAHLETVSELRVVNTICDATRRHQEAALELARRSDLMIVVGSRSSANTRRLAELCSALVETHYVETAQEIDPEWLGGHVERIGVTAGASTPDEVIDEVISRLKLMQ